jgi:superoxide dismutase, Fe-Mn family
MTHDIERRDFLHGLGLAAGVAAASTLIQQPAQAQTAPQSGAKPMAYVVKPFTLDPKSVKGISEKVLISHAEIGESSLPFTPEGEKLGSNLLRA